MKHVTRNLLIALALLLIGGGALFLYREGQSAIVTPPAQAAQVQSQQAKPVTQVTDTPVISGEPVALSIPSLDLNLAITPGVYNAKTRQWTLTTDKVQYAVMTPQPNNQAGNTFLYGHYRKGVFATLHNIAPNSKAVVTTANGKTFTYVLDTSRVVSPEDSDAVFNYQGAPILTIQTCTGAFFQNRQLFTFKLEGVS